MTDLTDLDDYSKATTAMDSIVFAIVRNKNKKLRTIGRLVGSLEIARDDPDVLWDVLMKIKTTANVEDKDDDLDAGE